MNTEILNLVISYKEGKKEEDLLELWSRFQPLVINCTRKFHIPARFREDARQESFIHLAECLDKFDLSKGVPFESFFKMSLSYFLLKGVRKKTETLTVDKNWQEGNSLSNTIESTSYDPEESLEKEEIGIKVHKALGTLTQKQRTAVVMFYMEGYAIKDIAAHLGCSYSVSRKHKDVGLKKLRDLIG